MLIFSWMYFEHFSRAPGIAGIPISTAAITAEKKAHRIRPKKMLNRPGKRALTTSSLRDARGAELKRRGIKRSIRIDRRRGISRAIRRVRSCSLATGNSRGQGKRAAFIRNTKGKKEKVVRPLFVARFLALPFLGGTTVSILSPFCGNSIFWLSNSGREIVSLSLSISFFLSLSPFLHCSRRNKANDSRIIQRWSGRSESNAWFISVVKRNDFAEWFFKNKTIFSKFPLIFKMKENLSLLIKLACSPQWFSFYS